jgi:tetratricopeptide (TPR) repeat protein
LPLSPRGFIRRLVAAGLIASAAVGTAARADDADPDQAREHYTVGLHAFDLGKYDEAISEFQEAYRFKEASGLLYNIAQAYRLSHRPKEALDFYQQYLARKPDAPNRSEVLAKIDRMQALLEDNKEVAADSAAATAAPSATIPAAPSAAISTAPGADAQHADAPHDAAPHAVSPLATAAFADAPAATAGPGTRPHVAAPAEAVTARPPESAFWTKRTAAWIAGSAGVAALAVGVVFALDARGAANQLQDDAVAGHRFDPGIESRGQSAQTLSRVLFATGLVGLATSGLLFSTSSADATGPAGSAADKESPR